MKTADVIAFYGSKAAIARAVGCHRASVQEWGERVPPARQFEIEVKTGGVLKSDYTLAKAAGTPSRKPRRKRTHAR